MSDPIDIRIRPILEGDQDLTTIVQIQNAAWPNIPTSVEQEKHHVETASDDYLRVWEIIEVNEQPVAFGRYYQGAWSYHPDKYRVQIAVRPESEDPAIRPAYFKHVREALVARHPQAFIVSLPENDEQGLAYLKENGYREVMREPVSRLDVQALDFEAYQALLEKVQQRGIEISSIKDLKRQDPDWRVKLYDLHYAIDEDVPRTEELVRMPFEQYEKSWLGMPTLVEEGWLVAMEGEHYVGMTNLFRMPAKPETLDCWLTGVIQPYRRQGIATALKVRSAQVARDLGKRYIETANEEHNPMYELNQKLGFEPLPAWLEFEKVLESSG
jgi:GNAT superfamily N-acetyltransferase